MRQHTVIIAEVGINHNSSLDIAKQLCKVAKESGCDIVKFQKRTIDLVYTPEELNKPRESPWGNTNRQQKEALEFSEEQYDEIDRYCKELGLDWMCSAWDLESQKFLKKYDLKYNKIASAMLTYYDLLEMVAAEGKHTFISTGMSMLEEIDKAVRIFEKHQCSYELMHCVAQYPLKNEDANLAVMKTLRRQFGCRCGYSDHTTGRVVSMAAVAMGASSIERHITLNRSLYGSDQAASLEPRELKELVDSIRTIELAIGSPEKKGL